MASWDIATCIRAVAKYRNISVAATELGISQPALSARVRKLEDSLGAVLFDRSRVPLAITEEGRAYLACQEKIDEANRKLKRQLDDLSDLKRGHVVFGGAAFFNTTVLPPALAEFAKLHPGVRLTIVDAETPELTQAAIESRVDLFVSPVKTESAELDYEELFSERVFLCVPPETAERAGLPPAGPDGLAHLETPDARRLEAETFMKLPETVQIGQRLSSLFSRCDIAPEHIVEIDQMLIGLSLTVAGVGCSLVTESALAGYPSAAGLPRYLFEDESISTRKLYVGHARGAGYSRAAQEFGRVLKESCAQERS